MSQVTSVSQLSDVQPTDWAFQALQSLVERYGCIAGYPDGTFKGNRALSRYEFAAGVNACLDQITKQLGATLANFVTKEDLAILQKLQEEFAAELAALRGRIDVLDARTTALEANQFSTTTKLNGEVIFAVADTWGNRATVLGSDGEADETQTTLADRVRLNLNTSFTGQDLLRTRLQARNMSVFDGGSSTRANTTGTLMTRTSFDGNEDNQVTLDQVWYRFPAGQKATVWFGAKGLNLDDIADVITPFNSSGQASISRFGQRNPAVYRGPEGAGLGLTYAFSNQVKAQIGYLASDTSAGDPSAGKGVFNGSYSALAQLVFSPSPKFDIGLTYTHKYENSGSVAVTSGTGSYYAYRPFQNNATSSDNFGLEFNWKASPGFQLGGWFGYTNANQEKSTAWNSESNATLMNGAITMAFPDLFGKGNLGGIVVGVPPTATDNDYRNLSGIRREDDTTSLHLEAFYRFQVGDYISVTPGFYVLTDPDHNSNNDTQVVGVLRTTFSF
jgi:hypothetical protein